MARKTILVVDDEPDVLRLLEKGLSAEGYQVLTADNGLDAIELAKSKHPDVIILDVVLLDLDGGAVAAELRGDRKTRDIPIIFLTALISKKEEQRYGQSVGNNVTLSKPYDMDVLVDTVERCALV